jgi:hypothetical protein
MDGYQPKKARPGMREADWDSCETCDSKLVGVLGVVICPRCLLERHIVLAELILECATIEMPEKLIKAAEQVLKESEAGDDI